MKWLKFLIVPLIVVYFIIAVILNYYRLASLDPPKFDLSDIDYNTKHSLGHTTFKPTKFNLDSKFTRVSDEVPYMGTHYTSIERMFQPFNPDKPTGYMTWRGNIVGYFYSSDKPILDYHWHYHKNFCMRKGLSVTTKLSAWECISRGYYYWPNFLNRYMLHVWLDNPAGINELWNPRLYN